MPFDSVDSTAWLHGNMGAYLYHFTGTTMTKMPRPDGMRMNGKAVATHNFQEWIKFQDYADR